MSSVVAPRVPSWTGAAEADVMVGVRTGQTEIETERSGFTERVGQAAHEAAVIGGHVDVDRSDPVGVRIGGLDVDVGKGSTIGFKPGPGDGSARVGACAGRQIDPLKDISADIPDLCVVGQHFDPIRDAGCSRSGSSIPTGSRLGSWQTWAVQPSIKTSAGGFRAADDAIAPVPGEAQRLVGDRQPLVFRDQAAARGAGGGSGIGLGDKHPGVAGRRGCRLAMA